MFAGTAKAVLDGRALEPVPIMEYVWERTNSVLAKEELLGERECADGRYDGKETGRVSGARGTPRLRGRVADVNDRRRQAAPGCGIRPVPIR